MMIKRPLVPSRGGHFPGKAASGGTGVPGLTLTGSLLGSSGLAFTGGNKAG